MFVMSRYSDGNAENTVGAITAMTVQNQGSLLRCTDQDTRDHDKRQKFCNFGAPSPLDFFEFSPVDFFFFSGSL